MKRGTQVWCSRCPRHSKYDKGLFTLSESGSENEIVQRTIEKDQRISDKHQSQFSLSLSLSVKHNIKFYNLL